MVPVEAPFVDEGPTEGPPEALVLDIGDDIGALVLYADEACLGMEIDLTPVGAPRSHHIHTMIRRRRAVDREFIAGVYPELRGRRLHGVGNRRAPTGRRDHRGRPRQRVPCGRLPHARAATLGVADSLTLR